MSQKTLTPPLTDEQHLAAFRTIPQDVVKYEIEEYIGRSLVEGIKMTSFDTNFELWDKTSKILFLYANNIIRSEKYPHLKNRHNPDVKSNEIYQEDAWKMCKMWGRKKDSTINALWNDFCSFKIHSSQFPKIGLHREIGWMKCGSDDFKKLDEECILGYKNRIKKSAYHLQECKGVERLGKKMIRLYEPSGYKDKDNSFRLTFWMFRLLFFPTPELLFMRKKAYPWTNKVWEMLDDYET